MSWSWLLVTSGARWSNRQPVLNGVTVLQIDCRHFHDPDNDRNLRGHVGRHPGIMRGLARNHAFCRVRGAGESLLVIHLYCTSGRGRSVGIAIFLYHFFVASEWRSPKLIHFHSPEWSEMSCSGRCEARLILVNFVAWLVRTCQTFACRVSLLGHHLQHQLHQAQWLLRQRQDLCSLQLVALWQFQFELQWLHLMFQFIHHQLHLIDSIHPLVIHLTGHLTVKRQAVTWLWRCWRIRPMSSQDWFGRKIPVGSAI